MIKDEAKFHSQLMVWLSHNLKKFPKSFKIETKVVRRNRNTFSLSELSAKEERLLLQAKHGTCIQTNSDYGGMGTYCDGDVVSGGGFIFIKWIRRGNKEFMIIDIDALVKFREDSGAKLLDEKNAKIISYSIEYLK